jgi:hypothetical protein
VENSEFEVKITPGVESAMVNKIENGVDSDARARKADWRVELLECSNEPGKIKDRKVRCHALKYVVVNNMLCHRTLDGVILKCLSTEEDKVAMGEVHGGMCGTHESAHKMRWTLRRTGVYWPMMLNDCFEYYRGCEVCQKFRRIQVIPASMLHPIIKPWLFRGWGLDFMSHPVFKAKTKCSSYVCPGSNCHTYGQNVSIENQCL